MCNCKPGGDDAARCYPSSLTDEVWSVIEPLLPVRDLGKGGRPRVWPDRLVLDSIFYVLRAGCQWRMVPHDLAPWWVAYRRYRSWAADGTWDTIHDQLRAQIRMAAGRDPDPTAAVLDAQSIKSSEGGEARGFDMGKKTTGRKRHLVVDTLGLLLVVMVTSAAVQDRQGGRAILALLAARFPGVALVWADGGYANKIDSGVLPGQGRNSASCWRSSSAATRSRASRSCHAVGWLSGRLAGWSATAGWPGTTSA